LLLVTAHFGSMKRIGKWILIAFALVVGAGAILLLLNPGTSVLFAAIFFADVSDPGPPPVAEGQITGYGGWEEGGRKLSAVLERRFPNGTPESNLISVLLGQGFQSLPPRPTYCLPPGQAAPNNTCPSAEDDEKRKRTLEYTWANGICRNSISIVWTADDRGEITHVQGGYGGGCL
jgi:hypothetical protein